MCSECNQERVVTLLENVAVTVCGCAAGSRFIPQVTPKEIFDFRRKVSELMLTSNS